MREILLFVLIAVLIGVGRSQSFLSKQEVKVKAPVTPLKECKIDEVNSLGLNNCSIPGKDGRLVPHGQKCMFTREDDILDENLRTVEHLICNDGHWSGTDFSVGYPVSRQKRFLWLIAAAIIATCAFLCGRLGDSGHSGHSGGSIQQVTYYPPEFSYPCKPTEVKDNYNVAAGDSVVVSWTDPKASDKNGGSPTVQQVSGGSNGGGFPGAIGGKTHYITYMAEDDKNLKGYCHFSFTVTEKTCATPQWLSNGQRKCDDFRVGSQCRYECHVGYELVGNSVVTCENTQTWSSIPTCENIKCDPPTPPANGRVDCTDLTYPYQSFCVMKCNEGYSLQGQLYTQCKKDGTWFSIANTTCIDDSPPSLVCKTPQIFYADRGSTSTSVTWEVPTVYDSSDPAPEIFQTSGPSMDDVIHGSEYVTYKAIDSDGNRSPECSIEIRVQEITCGHPLDTLKDNFLAFNCSGTRYAYGVECRLSCLAHLPLNGTDLITCENNGTSNGVWDWGNGTEPFCREIACPELDPPINGALVFDSIQTRPVATMMCNDKFEIPYVGSSFNGMFFCLDLAGWKPSEVPDCSEASNPRGIRLLGKLFYYGEECGTNKTMAEIKQHFIEILKSEIKPRFGEICLPGETCTAEDIVIVCGPIQDRRKRSATLVPDRQIMNKYRKPIHSVVKYPHKVQKRQAESSHLLVVELDIVLTMTLPEGASFQSEVAKYDEVMDSLSSVIQGFLNNGSLDIQNFTTKSDSWKTPDYADIDCGTGYILDGAICKPCPSGQYLNETTTTCHKCPIGQYTGEESSIDCMSCPAGYSTKQTGSKLLDHCIELCGPGTSSPDGMLPCSACLYGEYQDDVGQTTCKQCPSGTTTQTTNTTSSQDCQSYDTLIEDTGGPASLANIPSGMNDMTFMFWTKRSDERTLATTIQLTSDGNDRCILYLTENVRFQIPNKIDETVEKLSSDTWKHVAVVWNTAVNNMAIYINGDVKFSSTVSSSTQLISNGELILSASGQSGLYLTGLHLLDRVLTASEIATHASSCQLTEIDNVIDIDIFQEVVVNGVSLLASSSCDAIDNCEPDPCNGHQCIDGQDTFVCHCNSHWSGDTCSVPPDYCINNECTNGATCQNGVSNYTCDCLPGYSGTLCEIPPIAGGWSEWEITSSCTHRCGTGSQNRIRSCDNPLPELYGAACVGNDEDTIPCNTEACQVCENLPTTYGTLSSCMTDQTTGTRNCTLYCEDGKIMPPGLQDSHEYECGPNTNYAWTFVETLPSCVEPLAPIKLAITTSIEYSSNIPEVDVVSLTDSVLDNFQSTPCSGNCETSLQMSDTRPELSITFSVNLSNGPDLHIDDYIADGTVSGSLKELVDSVNDLELTAQYLQNFTTEIFNVAPYTVDISSLMTEGVITCPDGQVAYDGTCLKCPAGTYSNRVYCIFCEKGTYQPSFGESVCIQCPSSLTTETIGSTDLSKCSEPLTTTTSSPTPTEPTSNKTAIVAVVLSINALVIACLAFAFIWYKKYRYNAKVSDSHSDLRKRCPANTSATVHYTRKRSNMTNTRPATPSNIPIRFSAYNSNGGNEERYTQCPPDGGYVTPISRDSNSPPPSYDATCVLPEYSEKNENPYNSIIELDSKTMPEKLSA